MVRHILITCSLQFAESPKLRIYLHSIKRLQKRIDFSKELLRTTELPIGEIALRAGYVEINSFIKTFKNVENMTPHAYRQQEKVNDK